MTNTMTDDRKALIERLWTRVAALEQPVLHDDGAVKDYEPCASEYALLSACIAALSAQPSPDAAQQAQGDADEEQSFLKWWRPYQLPGYWDVRPDLIAKHAWMARASYQAKAQDEPDAAHGGKCGEVPHISDDLIRAWSHKVVPSRCVAFNENQPGPSVEWVRGMIQEGIAWDRQRAASAGKPYAYKVTWPGGHDFTLYQPDKKTLQDRRDMGCELLPLYTHPPADAVSSVQDEGMVTLGVGDGSGKLFVHGDYDAIKACQTMIFELEKLRSGIDQAVASMETPPEVKGRVMSEMFWKGVYALQSRLATK